MRGTPQTMQDDPVYDDVINDVAKFLEQRIDALISAGVSAEQICVDPGIGFGKTHQHNWTLLANAHRFHQLGRPLLIGHSRKGFIGKALDSNDIQDRDEGTMAISMLLAQQQVQILRVHNVALTRRAITMLQAIVAFSS
jgi:dihydropteroate synthase